MEKMHNKVTFKKPGDEAEGAGRSVSGMGSNTGARQSPKNKQDDD